MISMTVLAPLSAFAATNEVTCEDTFGTSTTGSDTTLKDTLTSIIRLVGGIGGLFFTLCIMIVSLVIIFVSISPKQRGIAWVGLFGCFGGAFIFFAGYKFAGAIAVIAGANC
nr:hypothetical protein [Paenibacillus periandrae]